MKGQQGIPLVNLDDGLGHVVALVIGLVFLAAAVVAIIRIVRGPSILDRMIATDALLATIMCGLGGVVAFSGRTDLLPVMLVISMFGFVGAVGVSRYVSRADLRTTSRYRQLHRNGTGSIGTVDGVEPSVPEFSVELEEARRSNPERAARMEGSETEWETSSLQVRGEDDPTADAPQSRHDPVPPTEAVDDAVPPEAVADSGSQSSQEHEDDDVHEHEDDDVHEHGDEHAHEREDRTPGEADRAPDHDDPRGGAGA